ncbi:MAG TPA: fatty acid desaturase [Flavobacteriales bacterium]|nr:fatty acid desaturase [Flavobacteriales bacterium]
MAITVIGLWVINLVYLLNHEADAYDWKIYILFLFQIHLYTGLFITAHDAIHQCISKIRIVNNALGNIASVLFMFNSYSRLHDNHMKHHRYNGTSKDPDHHEKDAFFPWIAKFVSAYVTWKQIFLVALAFNLLWFLFPIQNVILFYALPSILATFQMFYFVTYAPHMGTHENRHKSRTQSKNHLWAFLSCYFFGYHYEHHDAPWVPWWKLFQEKNRLLQEGMK